MSIDEDRPELARADKGEDSGAAPLPAVRLIELRRWIEARGYDAPEVVEAMALILIARRAL